MPITNARVIMRAIHLWLTMMDTSGRGRPVKRMCATAQQRKAQEPCASERMGYEYFERGPRASRSTRSKTAVCRSGTREGSGARKSSGPSHGGEDLAAEIPSFGEGGSRKGHSG